MLFLKGLELNHNSSSVTCIPCDLVAMSHSFLHWYPNQYNLFFFQYNLFNNGNTHPMGVVRGFSYKMYKM